VMLVALTVPSLVRGWADDDVKYTPTQSHTFKPRKAPAKITGDNAKTLTSMGYIKLGNIGAFYPAKSGESNGAPGKPTERMLKEAASRGGDVVLVDTENVPTVRDRYKQGACLKSEMTEQLVTTPAVYVPGACNYDTYTHQTHCEPSSTIPGRQEMQRVTRCTEWEQVRLPSIPGFLTTGSVWRHTDMDDQWLDSALGDAAQHRDVNRVKELLQSGVSVGTYDNDCATALQEAADRSYIEIVKLLLDHGANVNSANPLGTRGERKCGKPRDFINNSSPLMLAAWNGDMEIASLLVEHGADVNQAAIEIDRKGHEIDGQTPLMYAAEEGNVAMMNMLVSRGARVNQVDAGGITALFHAVWSGRPDSVKALLALGADKNVKDKDGQTLCQFNDYVESLFRGDKAQQEEKEIHALVRALLECK
jgi:hypothetical protein